MANGGIIGTVNTPTSTTATGVWQQEEQYEAVRDGTWPSRPLFTTNSLRFNSGSSDYLTFTPSATPTGSAKTWTYSVWVKMAKENPGMFLAAGSGTQSKFIFGAYGGGNIDILTYEGYVINANTARLFRDPSAFYHVVLACDTTQAVAANGIKLYINGVQETLTFESEGSENGYTQNTSLRVGTSGEPINIGKNINDSQYFDGYMAEAILVDGQQLSPTSFGSTNSDGVWIPAIYTGTYGTNGFNLQFQNSAALGTDSSPNGNTFTVNNLTSIDQSTDYPVVNFATLNSLNVPASNAPTFSEGNLQSISSSSASGSFGGSSTIGVSSGKWYIEAKCLTSGHTQSSVGVTYNDTESARTNNDATDTYEYSYRMNGNKQNNGDTSYGDTYTTNDIIGIALDLDNNKIYFSKNGTFQNSGVPTSGSTGTGAAFTVASGQTYMFYHQDNTGASSNTSTFSFNFGSPAFAISSGNADGNGYGNFEYAAPSGYYSLNTKNLAEFG